MHIPWNIKSYEKFCIENCNPNIMSNTFSRISCRLRYNFKKNDKAREAKEIVYDRNITWHQRNMIYMPDNYGNDSDMQSDLQLNVLEGRRYTRVN
jgi:hypothetical protein